MMRAGYRQGGGIVGVRQVSFDESKSEVRSPFSAGGHTHVSDVRSGSPEKLRECETQNLRFSPFIFGMDLIYVLRT